MAARPKERTEGPRKDPVVTLGARVIVVEDDQDVAESLREVLVDGGYLVQSAGTCREARRAFDTGSFEVALVDLQLPDGQGTELAGPLKSSNPDAEMVLLTGHASVESAAEAVRAGASAYLVKPCAATELLATVERSLRQVRLHAEKRDLARRAQMAEKLAAVGTLTAGLSHEIRNPLNAAALQLSVLERRIQKLAPDLQKPLTDPLTLVRDEIRRLDHILEDFLQFARPREFQARPVDLTRLLGNVVDLLQGDAERRHVSLERDFAAVPPVYGEEGLLRQVAMNLALNALEATPEGGQVRLWARGADRHILLGVDDSGPGVPPQLRERIFEPFFTTKASGSGLGLPIVHAIITQHGGTIAVEASPQGGARFVATLPRV